MGTPYLLKKMPSTWLLLVMTIAILGMNAFDALATVHWKQLGVEEANPFMAYILEYDTTLFIVFKTLGVTAPILALLYFARKRYAIAFYGLIGLGLIYLYPIAVHVFLYYYTSFK